MQNKIIEMIRQTQPDKNKTIEPNTDLIEEAGFDSVNMLELITNLEEAFGIIFEDDHLDLENFQTVKTIEKVLSHYSIVENV